MSGGVAQQVNIAKFNKELSLEVKGGDKNGSVLIVKINRPHIKNALNRVAVYELIKALLFANQAKHVKVVVLTGAADTFTTGVDLKQTMDEKYMSDANSVLQVLVRAFLNCSKILVALVNGPCLGIGFSLVALCDAVYCTQNAYFLAPFTRYGLCAEAGASFTVPLLMGRSWSSHILLFGEKFTAQKALELGFIIQIYQNENEVDAEFWPKMQKYAELPLESIRATKRIMKENFSTQMNLALKLEFTELKMLRGGPVHRRAIEKFTSSTQNKNKSKL